jgi:hypothetical protein
MIALKVFFIVGVVFFLLVVLFGAEKQAGRKRNKIFRNFTLRILLPYIKFYLFALLLVGLALNISWHVKDPGHEFRTLMLSAVMIFFGFFIFTATWLRMINKMQG